MVKRDGGGGNYDRQEQGRRKRTRVSHDTSVFVGNLDYNTKWQSLKDHMRKAGNVDNADIFTLDDGRPKGFALVVYQHPKEASRAIRELHDSELDGRSIFVREWKAQDSPDYGRAHRSDEHNADSDGSQLYVGNLSYEASWQDLKDFFRQCGDVEHADVIEGPNGEKKGFGIVRFSNRKDANFAIRRFDGFEWKGRKMEVRMDQQQQQGGRRGDREQSMDTHGGGGGGGGG
eukprot:CAMPEP_0119009820 /NCGR_PEP_ID=MMETSP1176-20130426/4622_1 /TAXON_ID=265551 /ORGANISM="Synedropsis recta cf, Strain CCMP1620" /LENGTH=230 /DNA_ID=CAMNT_0006962399 /DNA_START=53 /DNA_END=742 /DNA_ORIENTATION=-